MLSAYPKISIVTPSLNQDSYLEACISSILGQNYPNLEYIILDGGSTDSSVQIIKKYEHHLAFWQSAPDGGHYAAVNAGLARASGEILGWLNSDDMLHPKSLFVLAELFSVRPEVQFVTGKRIGFTESGDKLDFGFTNQRWTRSYLLREENFDDPGVYIMQEATYWRRWLWQRAGSTLDLTYKYANDFELWARFSRYTELYTVDYEIGGFRDRSSNQRSKDFAKEYLEECRHIIAREKNVPALKNYSDNHPPPLITVPIKPVDATKSRRVKPRLAAQEYRKRGKANYPRISIITPSFNQGEFLEECIDSVLSQNNCNIEYIIMDGGSSDDSVEIIQRYERYLAYWQSKPDGGQYAAINEGFTRSTGPIMAWLNADDKYHPGGLAAATQAFVNNQKVAWITGVPTAWSEDGECLWIFYRVPLYSRDSVCFTNYQDPWLQQESMLWSRQLWDVAGGQLDTRYKFAADLDLWRRFFRYAQLYSVGCCIGGFRQQPDQRSNIFRRDYIVEANAIMAEELALFKSGQYQMLPPAPEPILGGYGLQ